MNEAVSAVPDVPMVPKGLVPCLTAVQGSKVQKFNGRIQDKERFQWFQWFQSFQLDGAYV
jgi:hypothetical protein